MTVDEMMLPRSHPFYRRAVSCVTSCHLLFNLAKGLNGAISETHRRAKFNLPK